MWWLIQTYIFWWYRYMYVHWSWIIKVEQTWYTTGDVLVIHNNERHASNLKKSMYICISVNIVQSINKCNIYFEILGNKNLKLSILEKLLNKIRNIFKINECYTLTKFVMEKCMPLIYEPKVKWFWIEKDVYTS